MQRLREDWPELAKALEAAPSDVRDAVAKEATRDVRVQRRLRALLIAHPPAEPSIRPNLGRIDWADIGELVLAVYRLRSRALHDGVPMPSPMCRPPMAPDESRVPVEGGISSGYGGPDGSWVARDVPLQFHTFVYVVGEVLRSWWRSMS
jgi:hypothetical protein